MSNQDITNLNAVAASILPSPNFSIGLNGLSVSGQGASGITGTVTITNEKGEIVGSGPYVLGRYAFNLSKPFLNGEKLFATLTDGQGNSSLPVANTAPDITPPAPPTVVFDATGQTISGVSEPNAQIKIYNAIGRLITEVTVKQDGTYTVKLDAALTNGERITVTATDLINLTSVPTVAKAPVIVFPKSPTDVEVVDAGTAVTGKAEPGKKIDIKDANGNVIGTGTTDTSGNFKVDLNVPQKNGESISVTATDPDTTLVSKPTPAVAPDITPPNAPTATVDQTTGAVVTGKAQPGSDIEIKDATGKVIGTGKTDVNGDYKVDLTTPQKNGETVSVTASDKAGPSQPGTAIAPDLTPPNAPTATVDQTTGAVVTGKAQPGSDIEIKDATGKVIGTGKTDVNGDYKVDLTTPQKNGETVSVTASDKAGPSQPGTAIAPDLTPPNAPTATVDQTTGAVVTGKAQPGSDIEIKDATGKVIGTGKTDVNGDYKVDLTTPQKNGETVSVTASDKAGPSQPGTAIAPDLTPPNAPTATVDQTTGAVVTGKAQPGSDIEIKDATGKVIGTGKTDVNGDYKVDLTTPQKNGETVSVTASDKAGPSQPGTAIAPDLTPPNAPTATVDQTTGAVVTGKAQPGSDIEIKDATGKVIGTGKTDVNGDYKVDLTTPQKNGETVSVTASDKAGPSQPGTAIAPDLTPPNAPTATVDQTTGAVVTGKAQPGSDIEIKDATGKVIGTGKTDVNGDYKVDLTTPQKNGETVSVTASDKAGPSQPGTAIAPDLTPPNAPTATVDQTTGAVVTGKAQPGSDIEIKDATGKVIGTGKTDVNGDYKVDLTTPQKNGETVSVTASDKAGPSQPGTAIAPDLTPPNAPTATVDQTTGAVVTGKAQPGSDIEIKDATGKVIGTGKTDVNGDYKVDLTTPQKNGETVSVTASDKAGPSQPGTAIAPDLTPPNAPTAAIDQATGAVVTGKAQPNSGIEVKDAAGKVIGTGTTDVNGNYSVTLTTPQKNAEVVTVTASDAGGKSGPASATAPDLTPPNAPTATVDQTTGAVVTGKAQPNSGIEVKDAAGKVIGTGTTDVNGNYSVTLTTPQKNAEVVTVTASDAGGKSGPATATAPDLTPPNAPTAAIDQATGAVVTGKAQSNSGIEVKDAAGKVIGTGTTDASGNYSVTLTTPQKNGEVVTVTASDAGGKSGPASATAPDLTPPNAPTATVDQTTGAVVTGKAQPNSGIEVKDAAGKVIGTGTTDVNGNYSVTLTTPQKNAEVVTVTASDAGGKSGPATATAPDLTPPNAPTVTVDQTTGAVVTGKAQPNSSIEVKDAAGKVIGTGTTDANGNYSVTLTTPQKNAEVVTVTASDAGGKSGPATATAPDLTPPNAPTATVDQTTGAVVTGKAQPNSGIEVKDAAGKVIGTGTTDVNGNYSVTLTTPQKNAEVVTVTASDAGGKSGPATATAPDLTPPNAPTVTVDQTTGAVVTGKAQPNSSIEVKDAAGKVIGTGTTDANGNYSVTLTTPQKNAEVVTVTASDAGGKSGPATATAPDLTPPQINTLQFSAKGDVLSGTTEGYAKVEIKDASGKIVANTTADANGNFSVTFSKPYGSGEGVTAKATDLRGNTGDAKFVQAPSLLTANPDVVHADVDLGYVTSTSSKTTSIGFGSLGKFLGIPILGSNAAEVNFSVNANETSTVNIKAYNTSLSSLFDGVKVTLYKQAANGVWQKVADSKDLGLFNKFFLFSEATGLQVKSLDLGNYKVVAEDTTLFGIFSGNKLSVTQNTTTTSGDLEVIKANSVSGNLMVDDVVPNGTTLTKLVSDTGASVSVSGTGTTTLVGKYGSMLINADGSYTYTPNKDVKVVGQVDTFTYTITDKNGNASSAKVYVQIGTDEVNIKWDPTDPSKPGTMLQLNNDSDFVVSSVSQSTAVTTVNVDSGLLSAQSSKVASINSNTFTVGNTGETSIKVDFKSAMGCYSDPSKTTFNWQLQKYNAQTGQWVSVSGVSGSKSYGFVGSVSSGATVFEQTVKVTDAGQYRVNFQTSGGLYSSSFLAQTFDTNVTVQTTSPDKWNVDNSGVATGNIFTGEGVDTSDKDSLGFGKKLSVSTDGGFTFKDVSTTGLTLAGKYGSLVMKTDGSYVYTQAKGAAGSEDFVYKVTTGNGETQTAHLEINSEYNVKGSAGNDVFTADQIFHVLEMGAGADTVKFTSLNTIDQGDYWTDFSKSQGDKIDVSTLLSNKNVTAANIGEYVTVEQKGTDTVIKIDLDAKGTQYEAKELVVLQNTNATLDDLLKGNHLVF